MVESKDASVGGDLREISGSPDLNGKTFPNGNRPVKGPQSKSKTKSKKAEKEKVQERVKAAKGRKTKNAIRYDPTESFMVPKHEVVDERERKELERMYGSLDLFPKVLVNDPIVIKLGAKEGDLIRIHREEGFYYRVVTRG